MPFDPNLVKKVPVNPLGEKKKAKERKRRNYECARACECHKVTHSSKMQEKEYLAESLS